MGKKLIDFNLYLITDRQLVMHNASLITAVRYALQGGVRAIQLREKDLNTKDLLKLAYKMRGLTAEYGAKFFVNDRFDIALAVGADGVHLTQKSIPVDAVRNVVNASRITRHASRFLIGVSTHSLKEAKEAERKGADFVAFGPVFSTSSKLKYGRPVGIDSLSETCKKIRIPVFAIGGITSRRIKKVMNAGAYGAAMISEIFSADEIKKKAEEIINTIGDG